MSRLSLLLFALSLATACVGSDPVDDPPDDGIPQSEWDRCALLDSRTSCGGDPTCEVISGSPIDTVDGQYCVSSVDSFLGCVPAAASCPTDNWAAWPGYSTCYHSSPGCDVDGMTTCSNTLQIGTTDPC